MWQAAVNTRARLDAEWTPGKQAEEDANNAADGASLQVQVESLLEMEILDGMEEEQQVAIQCRKEIEERLCSRKRAREEREGKRKVLESLLKKYGAV